MKLNQIAAHKIGNGNLYEMQGWLGNAENFKEMYDSQGKFGLAVYINDGEKFRRINLWGKRAHYAHQHFCQAPRGAFLKVQARKETYRDQSGKFRVSYLPVRIENLHEYSKDPFEVQGMNDLEMGAAQDYQSMSG